MALQNPTKTCLLAFHVKTFVTCSKEKALDSRWSYVTAKYLKRLQGNVYTLFAETRETRDKAPPLITYAGSRQLCSRVPTSTALESNWCFQIRLY